MEFEGKGLKPKKLKWKATKIIKKNYESLENNRRIIIESWESQYIIIVDKVDVLYFKVSLLSIYRVNVIY